MLNGALHEAHEELGNDVRVHPLEQSISILFIMIRMFSKGCPHLWELHSTLQHANSAPDRRAEQGRLPLAFLFIEDIFYRDTI
jgi:hypothetical protein